MQRCLSRSTSVLPKINFSDLQPRNDALCSAREIVWVDGACGVVERNVGEGVRWDDVQMHVGHLKSGDDERGSLTAEGRDLSIANAVGEGE